MSFDSLGEMQNREHEQLVFFNFPEVGLKAIVGIHNTTLGPALGGCRMRLYRNHAEAVEDALRLSEGMTYKSSIAGLDLGGGKSVLIADPHMKEGREELFLKFAECLERLNGMYYTAEDMGTSVSDIMNMRSITNYAAGFALDEGGSGDPSPWTALGVFKSINAACERKYGSEDLKNKHVTVQGAGHVGVFLIEHLLNAGAKVTISEPNQDYVDQVTKRFDVDVVGLDDIYDVDCDIYAPCAIGQTVNMKTISRLKCDIIAGAANNVLQDDSLYEEITKRGIMYCPDFVINSGGVISVGGELIEGGWNKQWVTDKVHNIYNTTHTILEESEKRGKFSEVVAIELAKERIAKKSQSGDKVRHQKAA